ncbi:chromate transporter [Bacillus sp. sid0103]|uniref:chromate transporter n=1 Tax=Bacillus sp. sid0103 TaxID=2856337 RepID=UPI001C458FEC|nr:chromate transporter [Bacillus sp. sid0103]MBV7505527.1 chromate transporter [Bacillus sp. sid0103]
MKEEWMKLFQIFWTFFKIGPVTFGGGYAIIPIIKKEVVDKKKWVRTEEITDVFAIAGSIPGAIAINSSTFVGYKIGGIKGAIAALIGVFLPTFLIVVVLSIIFLQIQNNPKIDAAFQAIRATIVALIAYAGYLIGKTAIVDKTTLLISFGSMVVLFFSPIHPVLIILTGMLLGMSVVKVKHLLGNPDKPKIEKTASTDELEWFMGDGI